MERCKNEKGVNVKGLFSTNLHVGVAITVKYIYFFKCFYFLSIHNTKKKWS